MIGLADPMHNVFLKICYLRLCFVAAVLCRKQKALQLRKTCFVFFSGILPSISPSRASSCASSCITMALTVVMVVPTFGITTTVPMIVLLLVVILLVPECQSACASPN